MSDTWEMAIGMEHQGEAFYKELAAKAGSAELKGVFERLAGEEQYHAKLFDMMRKGAMVANELAESSMIADLKNAFGAWADNFEESAVVEDAEALYRKANQLEQDSIAFYTDLKQKAETPPERQALDFIIGQEKIHARMTEALVDFARNPKQWVEDAEFRNISEY